ncbi:hypothetical protein BAUCODRAFT_38446 [Baudoinia panamericana UAMH 10762]|uniref:Transcription initiation factor TFIID subunit 8 n=1 Tax=Baudoinia panamericana (strain UAMH 10762) TaxID=717646 RepID=M2MLX5_BAUPA|nr:uncharacterized protein BAUCODRAFT_38446 [Baudoinia panamericana UAMH 10762]EMC92393.1 hypothetical protein BAUCODRAFT_38446 [Baudoinia panamericana UAMH 10762]
MTEPLPHAGTKRPYSSIAEGQPHKKRRVRHRLHHVQRLPQDVEPASQDPASVQTQLLRSITAALTIAGFDSVTSSALEMFRSHTEEYMLRFSTYIRTSMHGGRRARPAPPDFNMALSLMPNTSSASLLRPHLKLLIPEGISYPSIPEPIPAPRPAPDLSALLRPLTSSLLPNYIPKHFPPLPPQHSWKQTPVFPERETDPRKMREKATEEGMLAEQALRRLATAAKSGALKAEKKRSNALSGPGKARDARLTKVDKRLDLFADVMGEIGGKADAEGDLSMAVEGATDALKDGIDVGMPEGVVVNYEMGLWRHGRHE